MPKRKRDGLESERAESRAEDGAVEIRKARLEAKTDQGIKTLTTALKLARGFERQKLGRRQKAAKEDGHELLRLKEEVIYLKSLDLVKTAQNYLLKQLIKMKRIRESLVFVSLYGDDPIVQTPKVGAEANVTGRLFNSNPIKEVLPGIMSGIYGCLGLADAVKSADGAATEIADTQAQRNSSPRRSHEPNGDDFETFSTEDSEPHDAETSSHEDENEEEEDLADYDNRLASPSPSPSSESTDGESVDGIGQTEPAHLQDDSRSGSTTSISQSPDPAPKSSKPKARVQQTPAKTTFLPSLMLGGYFSGSESDSEIDTSAGAPQPRKNRRGQRARQKIAEQKFGSQANHVKQQQLGKKTSRDSGWDARKGATDGGDKRGKGARGRGGRFGERSRNGRTSGPTGANGDAVKGSRAFRSARKGKDDGPLHPSWEAAKKRKEQSQRISLTPANTGKKIVFD